MSKLDELIAELCPDGVNHCKLNEISIYAKDRIDAKDVSAETYIGVDNLLPGKQGKTISSFVPEAGRLVHFVKGDILIGNIRPYLKKIWLADCEGGTNGDVLVIHIIDRSLEPDYLYYCLSSDRFFEYDMQFSKGAKMPRGDKTAIMDYRIPVPPLEIQHEIVRILDNFTELTAALTATLTSELAARKKQYAYYREGLLEFDQSIPIVPIKDIARITIGEFVHKNKQSPNAEYPVFNGGTSNTGYYDDYNREANKIIISARGANAGFVNRVFTRYWSGNSCYTVDVNDTLVDWNYVYYWLKANEQKLIGDQQKAGIPAVSKKQVENFMIAIPNVKIQKRIVAVFEQFDDLCSGIIEDLPAEIAARQQQYEYYRDKLLTFKEA